MAPRRRQPARPLPTFDPQPSLEFGSKLLSELHVDHALIGKVAMWFWLENPADHEHTKDVDFAVPSGAIPAITQKLQSLRDVTTSPLPIGGINASDETHHIRTDFIDRSSDEWGDLHPLYRDAIDEALRSEDRASGAPVASPEHLVAMKLGAGTDKNERDAIRLLAKVEDLDVDHVRGLVRKFLGPAAIGRLEECIRRAGHPKARRAYTEGS